MITSDSDFEWQINDAGKYKTNLVFLSIFLLYLLLRIFAWKYTTLLAGTDSLFYLENIKVFLTFDLQEIINLDPDSTPFYPFFGALFSLPGWSVMTGARLASLFFSCVLFISVLMIGKQIAKPLEIIIGLLILSLSPVLISLSFIVMTEPSYIAMVYFGFWFFWTQYKNPQLWKAVFLGIIFGLAFLSRVEGILYIAVIPFLQGIYIFIWEKQKHHNLKHFIAWASIYIICFAVMAIPQIWRVSHKMGILAINGRQVWSPVMNNPDGKSWDEKLFSLDFSPSEFNIEYIKKHPEALNKIVLKPSPFRYVRTLITQFNRFYQKELGILIGPLGLIFFTFGIIELYRSKKPYEIFLILAFVSFSLIAPLLYNVAIRHIIIIAPIIFLTSGIGIVYVSRNLLESAKSYSLFKHILPFIFLFALVAAWGYPLVKTFRPPDHNREYSPAELIKPIEIVKAIGQKELRRAPIISSQRGYLAYFADGKQFYLPYTDYKGVVKYCELNNVDFLYLKHKRVKEYPFFQTFSKNGTTTDFSLLYSGVDPYGEIIELYRFLRMK